MSDFIERMIKRAATSPKRICFPEATNSNILKLAEKIVSSEIGTPVLVGDFAEISSAICNARIDATNFDFFDIKNETTVQTFCTRYLEKFENFSQKALLRRIENPLACSMLLLKDGFVDAVAAGKENPSGEVIAKAMQIIGLQPGIRTPSTIGIADIPSFSGSQGTLLGLADCALTPQPDVEELAGIAISSADTVKSLLRWTPRVALLSFSTCGSAEHETINVIRQAKKLVNETRPDILCDGELQLDAALIPDVAQNKTVKPSGVAGKANVLVFPNLHAGNIGIKMVQIFASAHAYGPILQGFNGAICDFSRSAPLEEMLGNVAMLVIRAA